MTKQEQILIKLLSGSKFGKELRKETETGSYLSRLRKKGYIVSAHVKGFHGNFYHLTETGRIRALCLYNHLGFFKKLWLLITNI